MKIPTFYFNVHMVNVPCAEIGNLVLFGIFSILIHHSLSHITGKVKTSVSCYHIDPKMVPSGRQIIQSTLVIIRLYLSNQKGLGRVV